MANQKTKSVIKETYKRIFLPLAAAVLSTVVLVFCVLTLLEINKNGEPGYHDAPRYLLFVFIFLALTNIVTFFKDRTKLNFIKSMALLIFNVILGIIVLFGKQNSYIFSLVAGLYCVGIVISRIFSMIQHRTIRSYVFNGLIILLFVLLALSLIIGFKNTDEDINVVILLECVIIAIASFCQVFALAASQLKLKVLGSIILKTYALEILFGLISMMVCFALIFMYVEPSFENFGNSIWYCFAVVTTIGFGDYTCVTWVGRILTAILGVYGLIVVAVITSIFVNFYNETAGRNDKKELKDIKKQDGEDK